MATACSVNECRLDFPNERIHTAVSIVIRTSENIFQSIKARSLHLILKNERIGTKGIDQISNRMKTNIIGITVKHCLFYSSVLLHIECQQTV